jgi:hypothetical protein
MAMMTAKSARKLRTHVGKNPEERKYFKPIVIEKVPIKSRTLNKNTLSL